MKTFEEWWPMNPMADLDDFKMKAMARSGWDARESELAELRARLALAESDASMKHKHRADALEKEVAELRQLIEKLHRETCDANEKGLRAVVERDEARAEVGRLEDESLTTWNGKVMTWKQKATVLQAENELLVTKPAEHVGYMHTGPCQPGKGEKL